MNLIDKLRAKLTFDKTLAYKRAEGNDGDYYFSYDDWTLSAKLENDRLSARFTVRLSFA